MTQGGVGTPDEPAERLAAAVLAVPGVEALHPGMFGEVGTYLPGRRIAGIRITDHTVDVHVVVVYGVSVRDTAAAVRTTVSGLHPSVAVNVTVEDIAAAPSIGSP